jgi:hypothetical protein
MPSKLFASMAMLSGIGFQHGCAGRQAMMSVMFRQS